jgi:TonB-dependent starch-binding outer membrane protein SusC
MFNLKLYKNMKKNPKPGILWPRNVKKLLLTMKISFLLLVLSVLNVYATNIFSQNGTVSVDMQNATVREVVREIERQGGINFLFNDNLAGLNHRVNVSFTDQPIRNVLTAALSQADLTYEEIKEDFVVLLSKVDLKTQDFRITGSVILASEMQTIPGVTVLLKGTGIGTVTDIDGNYTITLPDDTGILVFSYVGMETIEIPVEGRNIIDVEMTWSIEALEEIVVIGYGTQRRADVTSAVSHVQSENFIQGHVKDAGQLLQGKVAGLTVSNISGNPTASSEILLRGTATLSTSTQPLVLIDGIPGNLNTVAPEDILSIDVLKDGSAAAIYGTRGTNGVILITTRKPDGSAPTFNYSSYFSTQQWVGLPEMLNAAEYRQKITEGVGFFDGGAETDWIKAISREFPLSQNHRLTFTGGSQNTNYLGSFNYRDTEGIITHFGMQTINSRVDLNHSMMDNRFRFNLNFINNINKSDVNFSNIGEGLSDSQSNNIFHQALWRNPTDPIKNTDGTWHEEPSKSYYENPVGLLNETYGGFESQTTRLSGSINFEPIDNLNLQALVSTSNSNNEGGQGQTKQHLSAVRDGYNGYASKSFGRSTENLLELTGQFRKVINSHQLTALAGYSYQHEEWQSSSNRNWDFPAGNFSYIDNIGAGQRANTGDPSLQSSSKYAANLIGFFGRVTYDYLGKYLVMANLRHEASSRFVGTNKPWGTFPSISVGWRISDEDFLNQISSLSDLKIRAGYGVTGTAPSQLFLGVSMLGYSGYSLIGGQWIPSLVPTRNPNPHLRWEEKREINIGLDYALFNYRFSGSIDYYNRTTDGLLYNYSVPTPPNAYGTTMANVGIMENKGLEILVNAIPLQRTRFNWTTGISFSTNSNKLVSISDDIYQTTNPWFNAGSTGSPIQTYTHRVEVGEPIGNFYGYKVIDVTPDGFWIYEDKDGNPSPTRLEEDKKVLGNGLPKWYANWNNSFNYGSWDFSLTMRGAFGYQILNYQRMFAENPGFTSYNLLKSAFDKVYGEAVLDPTVPIEYNSYYLEDGDFWKIDNIVVGYNFDNSSSRFFGSSRVYVSVLNALTLTGYKGMDPEVTRLGLTPGNDYRNKYPSTRVFTVGWSVAIN